MVYWCPDGERAFSFHQHKRSGGHKWWERAFSSHPYCSLSMRQEHRNMCTSVWSFVDVRSQVLVVVVFSCSHGLCACVCLCAVFGVCMRACFCVLHCCCLWLRACLYYHWFELLPILHPWESFKPPREVCSSSFTLRNMERSSSMRNACLCLQTIRCSVNFGIFF